jgi:hypothetical protein
MNGDVNSGRLFEEEPAQWGLRGDPYLWRKMREHFRSVPLPTTVEEFEHQLKLAFHELTGNPMSAQQSFFVAEFAHGGMSSGQVCPEFWRDRAMPLLLNRYAKT